MYFYSDIKPSYNDNRKLRGYDIVYDDDAVKQSLRNLFLINQGEMPGKPEFGNPLQMTIFDNFTFVTEKNLKFAIEKAVEHWEPRVILVDVRVTLAKEYNRIIVNLDYKHAINDEIDYDSLELVYNHNSISFLGGRIRPPETKERNANCHFEKGI